MPRSTSRRKKPRTERIARKPAKKPARRNANRRVEKEDSAGGPRRAKKERTPLSPHERKARNRTVLFMTVLGLINAYVFLWRGEGALAGLIGGSQAAVETHEGGPLPPVASPPAVACTGDAVRIFEGLDELVYLESSLTRGFTLRLALLGMGIEGTEIDRIESNVREHVDLSLLGGSGAPVRVAMDRLGGVSAMEIELAEGHVLQACRDDDRAGGFSVRNIQHPLRSDVEVIALTLGRDADLAQAVEAAGEKPELARRIARELAHDVDFMTEVRPDDELTVVVEKRWLGRSFHRYGALLAIRFHGAAARVEYFRYKPEGAPTGLFDAKGRPVRRALLRTPIAYHGVSPEARGMLPPSLEVVEGRVGAAYRLAEGAPLQAVAEGIVVDLDRDADRGLFLDLELDDGTLVRYAHMARVIGSLEVGSKVVQGQLVGLAGHSGRTPHNRLRLEIWEDERTVDPMRLSAKGSARSPREGASVPSEQQARYEDDIAPRRRALRVAHG